MKKLITVVLACLVPVLAAAQVVILPGGGGGSSTITPNGIATATYCTDAGVTDAYACSLPSAPTYAAGLCLSFKAATANTGAATVNFNGVGAVTIVKVESGNPTTLADNDIRVGSVVNVCHDGTNFQMQSTLGAVPPGGGDALTSSTLAQFAATTSAQLATVMSDEVGTDKLVYNTSPTLVTPILGVAAGTSLDLSANLTTENGVNYCLDAVGTDAYACSLSPAITGYVTGTIYTFKAGAANTGAASLDLNAIGAKTIVKTAGGITTALADNDIRSGSVVSVAYDGTNLQLISPTANTAGGGGTPGGSDTQCQFNDAGSFGGDAGCTYNKTTDFITLAGGYHAPNGSQGAPAYTFSEATSGLWSANGSDLAVSYQGGLRLYVYSGGIATYKTIAPDTNGGHDVGLAASRYRQLFIDETITAAGTTGARTIDKAAGTVNFAAAATAIVVTNSLTPASAASIRIFNNLGAEDTTCKYFYVSAITPATSFTITTGVGCTAEKAVRFEF